MSVILVGGGSRSGKSTYALNRAREMGARLAFIATAEAGDSEMCERIARHRQDRPSCFETIEEPLNIVETIRSRESAFDAVVVDCLTLWLSNMMLTNIGDLESKFEELAEVSSIARTNIIFVTNEVGCGIVPDTELGRQFRDAAGRLNQLIAAASTEIYWMVFGIPMRVK